MSLSFYKTINSSKHSTLIMHPLTNNLFIAHSFVNNIDERAVKNKINIHDKKVKGFVREGLISIACLTPHYIILPHYKHNLKAICKNVKLGFSNIKAILKQVLKFNYYTKGALTSKHISIYQGNVIFDPYFEKVVDIYSASSLVPGNIGALAVELILKGISQRDRIKILEDVCNSRVFIDNEIGLFAKNILNGSGYEERNFDGFFNNVPDTIDMNEICNSEGDCDEDTVKVDVSVGTHGGIDNEYIKVCVTEADLEKEVKIKEAENKENTTEILNVENKGRFRKIDLVNNSTIDFNDLKLVCNEIGIKEDPKQVCANLIKSNIGGGKIEKTVRVEQMGKDIYKRGRFIIKDNYSSMHRIDERRTLERVIGLQKKIICYLKLGDKYKNEIKMLERELDKLGRGNNLIPKNSTY